MIKTNKFYKLIGAVFAIAALSFSPATAQALGGYGKYAGASVSSDSINGKKSNIVGVFAGVDKTDNQIYTGFEAGYTLDSDTANDRYTFVGKVGVEVAPDLATYGIVGYGFTGGKKSLGGARYGIGAKYDVTDQMFVGVEYIHQELGRISADNVGLRAGFRF